MTRRKCTCNTLQEYGLPCWHIIWDYIANEKVIHEVPDIYLRLDYAQDFSKMILDKHDEGSPEGKIKWDYSTLVRKFEYIAALSMRNPQVKKAVEKLFEELQTLRLNAPGASIW